jgi:hypothetical protein
LIFHQTMYALLHLGHYSLTRGELVHVQAVLRRVESERILPRMGEDAPAGADAPATAAAAASAPLQPACLASWSAGEVDAFWRDVTALAGTLTPTLGGSGAGAGEGAAGPPPSYSPLLLLDWLMRTRSHFGYAPFAVHNPELPSLPPSLVVGVGAAGIFLLDASTKAVLKHFKYGHITAWAANTIKLSIRVMVARGKTQQLNFATPNGKRIVAAIELQVQAILQRKQAQAAVAAAAAGAASQSQGPRSVPPPVPSQVAAEGAEGAPSSRAEGAV